MSALEDIRNYELHSEDNCSLQGASPLSSEGDKSQSEENNQVFYVEKLLDKKIENGKKYYKVLWQGHSANESSWEPEENLWSVQKMINQFENELKRKKKTYMLEEEPTADDQDEDDVVKKKQKTNNGGYKIQGETKGSKHELKEKRLGKKKSEKLPSIGHLRYGDKPNQIIAVREMTKPGVLLFRVRWEKRLSGEIPTESYVSSDEFMKYNPRFLLVFYQSKMKFKSSESEKGSKVPDKKSHDENLNNNLHENLALKEVQDESKGALSLEVPQIPEGLEPGERMQEENLPCNDYSTITSPRELSTVQQTEEQGQHQEGNDNAKMDINHERRPPEGVASENSGWREWIRESYEEKNIENSAQGVEHKDDEGNKNTHELKSYYDQVEEDEIRVGAEVNNVEIEDKKQDQDLENEGKDKRLVEGASEQEEKEFGTENAEEDKEIRTPRNTTANTENILILQQKEAKGVDRIDKENERGDKDSNHAAPEEKETHPSVDEVEQIGVKHDTNNDVRQNERSLFQEDESKSQTENMGLNVEGSKENNQRLEGNKRDEEVRLRQQQRVHIEEEQPEIHQEELQNEEKPENQRRGDEPKFIQGVKEVVVFEERVMLMSKKSENQDKDHFEAPNNIEDASMDLINVSGSYPNVNHNSLID